MLLYLFLQLFFPSFNPDIHLLICEVNITDLFTHNLSLIN